MPTPTCRLGNRLILFFFFSFLSFAHLCRLLVFSDTKEAIETAIKTATDDDSPHGVISGGCGLLRQKTDRRRRLSLSSSSSPSETDRNPPRTTTLSVVSVFSVRNPSKPATDGYTLYVVNAALVKTRIIKVITKRKLGSNDYDLRLQMCSRKLPSTLRLSYDYLNVRRNLDVIWY